MQILCNLQVYERDSKWTMYFIITSYSTEHTFIDLFFEDTCVQVIRLWYIVISFRLWIIHDDDVLWLIVNWRICIDRCYWRFFLSVEDTWHVMDVDGINGLPWNLDWVKKWIVFWLNISIYAHVTYDWLQYDLCIWIIDMGFIIGCKLDDSY